VNDIVCVVNGVSTPNLEAFAVEQRKYAPGDEMHIKVKRGSISLSLVVCVGAIGYSLEQVKQLRAVAKHSAPQNLSMPVDGRTSNIIKISESSMNSETAASKTSFDHTGGSHETPIDFKAIQEKRDLDDTRGAHEISTPRLDTSLYQLLLTPTPPTRMDRPPSIKLLLEPGVAPGSVRHTPSPSLRNYSLPKIKKESILLSAGHVPQLAVNSTPCFRQRKLLRGFSHDVPLGTGVRSAQLQPQPQPQLHDLVLSTEGCSAASDF
jgi:hypothetical protein